MFFAKTLIVSLVFFAAHAFAQSAEKPDVKVGDRWSWQHTNALVNERDFTRIEDVIEVSAKEIRTRVRTKGIGTNGIATYTPEWSPLDVISAQYDPSLKTLSFPLQVGKKWNATADKMLFANGKHGKFVLKGEVVALEKITVPAGTFDVYKVVLTLDATTTDENANIGNTIETHWYAPAVKNDVKYENIFSRDGRVRSKDVLELLEFTLR